jgi:hypothetical protein
MVAGRVFEPYRACMVAGRVFEPWILSIDYCYTIIDVFEEPGIILNFILLFGFPRVFCVLRSALLVMN